jgi:hypothetical protein
MTIAISLSKPGPGHLILRRAHERVRVIVRQPKRARILDTYVRILYVGGMNTKCLSITIALIAVLIAAPASLADGGSPPSFKAVVDHSTNPPMLRFWLKARDCADVAPVRTRWWVRFVGGGGPRVSIGSQANPCKPFVFRPNYSTLADYAHAKNIGPVQVDFIVRYANSRSKRSWRFRATYDFTSAWAIEDTDFDNYVNGCINGNHSIYASGGHLWCTIPGTHTFGLKQI